MARTAICTAASRPGTYRRLALNRASSHRPALGARLRVRLHRWRLDSQLARGRVAGLSADHAVRAGQLSEPERRAQVARSLRRVVSDAEKSAPPGLTSAVAVRRAAIASWREGLLGLAERLEQPGPVNPCGVARALILLTDGAGPLYSPVPERSMSEMLWWVADGLQMRPVKPA